MWMPLACVATIFERGTSISHRYGVGKPVSLAFQRRIDDFIEVPRSKMAGHEVKVTLDFPIPRQRKRVNYARG